MIYEAGTSHIASSFSVIDIATVLYENLEEGDLVVWSKGWAAATQYYFLAKQGKIPYEDLEKFPNEPYLALAETTVNGVLVNGGSMGHGLPVAVGMAYAKKLKGEEGTVYCIMSDGELNEGTTWEAAILAKHHNLNNLMVVVDKNGWQAMGKTDEVLKIDPDKAFRGHGWLATTIDGHDYRQLEFSFTYQQGSDLPWSLICNTVKGKGVSFFEDRLLYHYKHVEKEEYEKALEELK